MPGDPTMPDWLAAQVAQRDHAMTSGFSFIDI
jgi:hypothetical protein